MSQLAGFLEICYNSNYYGVCPGNYSQQEVAEIACASFGYVGSKEQIHHVTYECYLAQNKCFNNHFDAE